MGWFLLLLSGLAGGISLLCLAALIHQLGYFTPDGRPRFIIGYAGVCFLLGFPGWLLVANGLARLGAPTGLTRTMAIAANVVLQPLLLHMMQGSARQLGKELVSGLPYFGGEVVPRERYTPEEYARIYRHCLFRDLIGTLRCAGLSLACLSLWL